MSRVLAIVGVTALASCTGDSPADLSPAQSAPPPFTADSSQTDTLNSLPESISNRNLLNSSGGVVGVTHLPP